MIHLRHFRHGRAIWQKLSKSSNHQDNLTTLVNTVSKSYIRSCSQLPASSTTNKKSTEKDVEYFRNLTQQLHPDVNESPEKDNIPTRNANDRSKKYVGGYKTEQNRLSNNSDSAASTFDPLNPLAKENVELSDVPVNFPPSFNFAAYVNKSETLQQLVKLGVDISKWDDWKEVPEFILKLDFEKDMQPHIQFLHDHGVPSHELKNFLTKNPLIFKTDMEELKVRINYLESKEFSPEAISRIITKAPYFLTFSTKQIDHRLGYLQKEFNLTGDELRSVIQRLPRLPLQKLHSLSELKFSFKEEMGFNAEELKCLFLAKPKLWLCEKTSLLSRFRYIHRTMKFSHDMIVKFPGALLSRKFILRQRHLYLEAIKRAQYDPTKPNYVSLHALVTGSDADFCANVAKTSTFKFNEFLKTM